MALKWDDVHSQLMTESKKNKELISASFELTSRCNMQCKMCYICSPANDVGMRSRELTTEQWVGLAKEARDIGLLFITLTGGEVFIRNDFREIYEQLMNMGFLTQIYTNGTLIDEKTVQWLKAMPPSKISITLYGTSKETYQKITGYGNGYERAVRAIDSLMDAGITTEVKTTMVKGNVQEIDEILEFVRQRHSGLGVVTYLSPRREGSNSDPLGQRLTPEELLSFELHLTEHNEKLIQENIEQGKLTIDDAVDNHNASLIDSDSRFTGAFPCNSGICCAWLSWDGRLLPCGLMDKPAAYPLEVGFKQAWEALKHECAQIPVCSECSLCSYRSFCDRCPGRLINETGVFDKPAPYLCETARLRTNYKTQSI